MLFSDVEDAWKKISLNYELIYYEVILFIIILTGWKFLSSSARAVEMFTVRCIYDPGSLLTLLGCLIASHLALTITLRVPATP